MKKVISTLFVGFSFFAASSVISADEIGSDRNSKQNPVVQPQSDALSGGGRDQSLQFGDILHGTHDNDFLVGRLGTDIIFGNAGDDILIGGTEDFNAFNRDRAFGDEGNDTFMWAPGDGSDFFDGGKGSHDVLMLGLIGELPNGVTEPVFNVNQDQDSDPIFRDPISHLPAMDVTNSPGFCTVVDASSSADASAELDKLNLTHLVRFTIRGVANSFAAGDQTTDSGLRVTIHTKNVEYLVCANRAGGEIEVLDLTHTPPRIANLHDLPANVQAIVR